VSSARRSDVSRRWPKRRLLCSALALTSIGALALLAQGCASDQQKINAIHAVNQGFRIEYEQILGEVGKRRVGLSQREALVALRVTLSGLGLHTEAQDPDLGLLACAGPAPRPLTDAEWKQASEQDTPLLRTLIEPHVGFVSRFVQFEPQGLDVVISGTVIAQGNSSEVSLTVRLREISPPRSGWPRREYVAPHLLRAGLDKIWAAFDQEVRATLTRP